ncbi:hypothetical protein [Comamonas sp. NLF-1-9]|uniref:hypothetical protein n=1 Tax=Comamonas sp. NLF-1-9 TaxID=2853163 RepID=UPI001C44E870|nr:hypothetical protein [Comamonas sp. NLF-1-9]QXL84638.1 hypothetical protein KUD94_01180 [Comamonas sp. NLF-1-9]
MIPFEIPAQYVAKLATGELVRYGAILKSAGTGKIVAHLQETGIAQQALSSLASPILAPVSLVSNAVNAGSGIYTAVQVSKIKAMVEALQSLQVTTLGLSLAGIGVSVAGFVYTRKRFNDLDEQLNQMAGLIETGFANQRHRELRAQISRTGGLVERARFAKDLSNPQREYREIAAMMADQSAYFDGEALALISQKEPIASDQFWQLTHSLMLCNNVRIDCGLRGNELNHTVRTAETIAASYQKLFDRLTPVSFNNLDPRRAMETIAVLRDASDSAASKPYLIDFLRTRGINGDEYLDVLEQDDRNPVLALKTT